MPAARPATVPRAGRWGLARVMATAILAAGAPILPARAEPAANAACLVTGQTPAAPSVLQARLLAALARVADLASPGRDPLLTPLDDRAVTLFLDDRPTGALGYFAPDTAEIVLDAGLDDDGLFVVLVHELRHLQQDRRGLCPAPVDLSRTDMLQMVFALEADAQAITTLYAWRKRAAGDPGPWQALTGHEAFDLIGDSFAAAIAQSSDPAQATAAAFSAWYAEEARVDRYYRATCSDWYDAQDREHRLGATTALPADFSAALCQMPDGAPYDCVPPATAP